MATARRWIAGDLGGPEVLREEEFDVEGPLSGEVTVAVRASGMNPADFKSFAPGGDRSRIPSPIGLEVAGTISTLGSDGGIASGAASVGLAVVAFPLTGGYATEVTVPAGDVFSKPSTLSFAQAANLLLVGTTAAEMLHVTNVGSADTILVHGASGAVGTSVIQQARLLGATVVGTAGAASFEQIERFGGIPVRYGAGLLKRIREVAPGGIDASLDTAGTEEAVKVSLELVQDRSRIVTLTAGEQARREGFRSIGAANPASGPFRAAARPRILAMAGRGDLAVPVSGTFTFAAAPAGLSFLMGGHPHGKLALLGAGS
jgi:NADPH2:quinone reductase